MLHSGGGGILDGSGGGAKVTPPTKGLGIIVTPVRRYIGEKKHVHPRGEHRLKRGFANDNGENLRLR